MCDCQTVPDVAWVIKLAKEAGALITRDYYKPEPEVSYKISSADLVTASDVAVEEFLVKQIKAKYPHHSFLCEESSKSGCLADEPVWVIDPIDGTMNFVKRIPFVAVSIGFACHKRVYLGVIYNPIMDELFYAVRGRGAHYVSNASLNPSTPRKMNVRCSKSLTEAVVGTGFSASLLRMRLETKNLSPDLNDKLATLRDAVFGNTQRLLLNCRDLRRTGSCACDMAYVAAGRLDALVEMSVKEWDVCAGFLLIEEAGGFVTNYTGNDKFDMGARSLIAACSRDMAAQLSALLELPPYDLRIFG